jgi:hypothetical protein
MSFQLHGHYGSASYAAMRRTSRRWRSLVLVLGVAVWVGCPNAPVPGPDRVDGRSDLEVCDAVIDSYIGCDSAAERLLLEVTIPVSGWKTSGELSRFLRSQMRPEATRSAISDETISDLFENSTSRQSSLRPFDPAEHETTNRALSCLRIRLVTEAEVRTGGIGQVVAVSRVGYNRLANQALIVVSRLQTSNPNGRGSSDWVLFLTRPAGRWLVFGSAPVSVV